MENDSAFLPAGNCTAITGAVSPPMPIQIGGPNATGPSTSLMSLDVWNSDATNDGFLAWGPSSAAATANAVVPTGTGRQVLPLPHGMRKTFTFPAGQWFTVVSAAGTPICYLTPGIGI